MIRIVKEPSAEIYVSLLKFAESQCESFSLVWRKQFKFAPSAQAVARDLSPFILTNDLTSEWPGTELIGHKAIVRRYRITKESISRLFEPGRLYGWQQPAFPEDLVFYVSGISPWLVTISHEYEGWFENTSVSLNEIRLSVPGIIVSERQN